MSLRSKAQMELIEVALLVTGFVILMIISYFFVFETTTPVSKIIGREETYNRVGDVIIDFQFTKVAGTEKSLAHLLGDGLISRKPLFVTYGKGYGILNISLLIENFFDEYFEEGHWQLELPSTEVSKLGYEIPDNIKTIHTFEINLPISSLRGGVEKVMLKVW